MLARAPGCGSPPGGRAAARPHSAAYSGLRTGRLRAPPLGLALPCAVLGRPCGCPRAAPGAAVPNRRVSRGPPCLAAAKPPSPSLWAGARVRSAPGAVRPLRAAFTRRARGKEKGGDFVAAYHGKGPDYETLLIALVAGFISAFAVLFMSL